MRLRNLIPKSVRGVVGTLILAPMLYAGFALVASTPARAAGVSKEACHIVSCTIDESECFESPVGICCSVCDNYECDDGASYSLCRTACRGEPGC